MADCSINGDSETPVTKPVILIVEDDVIIAVHHVQVLSSLGYTVLEPVATGEEAIGSVRAHKPDLVLMDIQLLGPMDGIETAGKIRAIADIPLVYITSYSDDVRLNQARVTEPYGYIVKPIESHELNATVRMALYKHTLDRKLKASEEKYRDIFENSVTGLFRTTPDGQLIHANNALARMYGYTDAAEMNKAGVSTGQLYADPEGRRRALSILAEKGTIENFEARHLRRDGTPFWVSITARTIRDDGARVQSIEGSALDTTGRRQAEDAFQVMVSSMIGTTGLSSLRKITESVSSWLGAECVMVGEIQPDRETVRVLSMFLDGEEIPEYSYTLKGTPCRVTADEGFYMYPDNVRELFPGCKDLVDLNVRGYVGVSLENSHGQVIGIICALFRSPVKPTRDMQEILEIIGVKAAAEIERMEMLSILKASEEHFRTILHSLQFGVMIIDEKTHIILEANQKALDLVGADNDTLSGSVCHRFICPAEEGKCPVTDLGQTIDASERFLLTVQGKKIPILKSVIRTMMGGRDVLIESFTDITELKRAEEKLRESKEKYRTLFESAGDMIFIHNVGGQILAFNTFACERLGYSREELQVMTVQQVDSPEDAPHAMDRVARLVETGHLSFETSHRRKDGTLIPIMVSARLITWEGQSSVLSICHDITDLKRAEGALRQANRKLTLLSGITRHDINNQLTVLIGFLTILEKRQNDPTIRKFFIKPITAAQRIASMIQFTREYEEIGTNESDWQGCRTLVTIAGQQAPLGDIILKNDLPRSMELFADPLVLKVFYNLLDNAARYGGKISTIRFSVEKSGKDRIIVCEDDGDGVPEKDKERIFDRGFGKNTGLGLALSREILDITGISIRENGELGKGARFEITVPKGACRMNMPAGSGPGSP